MPTYEYTCDACGKSFELQQRITEDPIKKCLRCGKPKARRLVGSGNFILKGGGWESDLYSGASNRAPTSKETSDSSSTKPSKSESASSTKSSKKTKKKAAD